MARTKKELNVEAAFELMEEKVKKLEDREITLEESFQLYQEGMELLKYCSDKIDQVEKKVMEIGQDGELHEF